MPRSAYLASLAALLAGTATAGPHVPPGSPQLPLEACCDAPRAA